MPRGGLRRFFKLYVRGFGLNQPQERPTRAAPLRKKTTNSEMLLQPVEVQEMGGEFCPRGGPAALTICKRVTKFQENNARTSYNQKKPENQ